jgi:hypothetical protein
MEISGIRPWSERGRLDLVTDEAKRIAAYRSCCVVI